MLRIPATVAPLGSESLKDCIISYHTCNDSRVPRTEGISGEQEVSVPGNGQR
jgi:hypothetical protein